MILHAARMLPLLVFLSLLALKPNRTPRAWLILIPVALVGAALLLVGRLLCNTLGSEMQTLCAAAGAVSIGVASVWLLLDRLAHRTRVASFFLALAILAVVGFAALLSYGSFDYFLIPVLVTYGFGATAALLSLTLAAFFCRTHYTAGRFLGFLVLATLIVTIVQTLPFIAIVLVGTLLSMGGGAPIFSFLAGFSVSTAIVAGLVFGLLLPYVILLQRSSFYNARFRAALRLPGMT